MTEQRDTLSRILDMIDACRSLLDFASTEDVASYMADPRSRYAVRYALIVLGEAARRLRPEIRASHPEIPWNVIVATRNRVAHGYDGIDDSILFATVKIDIVAVLPLLEQLAREHGADI